MIKLTKNQVIAMHSKMVTATGGTDGVRDDELLESALETPFQTFSGVDIYPTLLQKAARLGHSIVLNYPFVDGNKRIGVHRMLVFLALNGVELEYMQAELIDVGLGLSSGMMKAEKLFEWLTNHN